MDALDNDAGTASYDELSKLDVSDMTNTRADYYRWLEAYGSPTESRYHQEYGRQHYYDAERDEWKPGNAIDRFMSKAADADMPLADLPAHWLRSMANSIGATQGELAKLMDVSQSTVSRLYEDGNASKETCRRALLALYGVLRHKGDDDATAGYLGYLSCRIHERDGASTRNAEEREIRFIAKTIQLMAERMDMEGLLALHTMAMRLAQGRREDLMLTEAERAQQEDELSDLWPKVELAHDYACQLAACYPSSIMFRGPFDDLP